MNRGTRSKFYTISPMVSFVDTLADSIVSGRIIEGWPDQAYPYSLSSATIYMPTKRSAEGLAGSLKIHKKAKSLFLPKIVSIGEINDTENIFTVENSIEKFFSENKLTRQISPLTRRLILTKLINSWAKRIESSLSENNTDLIPSEFGHPSILREETAFSVAKTINDGLYLADSLGHLIDTLVIYKKTWKDVHSLLPQELSDAYWSISKDFLRIAAEAWPAYCHKEGVIDAAERRDLIISTEADRLLKEFPRTPFMIAGSTGSMPSTAKLICAISQLPFGVVVFPGIDKNLDRESLAILNQDKNQYNCSSHPQAILSKLIRQIGIDRDNISELSKPNNTLKYREVFLSECMRPYETTHLWSNIDENLKESEILEGLQGVSYIEADNERDEALTISFILRSALEISGKTAALITPDRSLAKRVNSELLRWGVHSDDSAGTPLHKSSIGTLASLLVSALVDRFSPVSLLALLNHCEVRLGLTKDILRKGISTIDLGLSRVLIKSNDIYGIRDAFNLLGKKDTECLTANPDRRLTLDDWYCANVIIKKFELIYEPFHKLDSSDLNFFLNLIEPALNLIIASPDDRSEIANINGSTEMLELFSAIRLLPDLGLTASSGSYVTFFEQLMGGYTVPNHSASHPRLKILGLLEARLLHFDLVILGGLDEGIWPPETGSDPFLNRPWREELGIPTPERRIGQTALDFISGLGALEVFITRSLKRNGSPMIASRFVQRMIAVAGTETFKAVSDRGEAILNLARKLDDVEIAQEASRPEPIPPAHLLPRKLSVTEVELLRRDPYSIYAKHVLRLEHLEKIGYQIGNRERGNIFHLILSRFTEKWSTTLPDDALNKLLAIGEEVLALYHYQLSLEPFWAIRLRETGRWYLGWEKIRRDVLTEPLAVERRGALSVQLPRGGDFILSGQVDRIEFVGNGKFNIIDFKTGKVPSQLQVRAGFSPQLTLEAAMLKRNAFNGLSGIRTHGLIYIKIGGKGGGEEKPIRDLKDPFDCDEVVERHFLEFIKLVDDHWNGSRPFYSRPHPQFTTDFGRYDHLARVKEWSLNSTDADTGDNE